MKRIKQLPTRQRIRKGLLLFSFLLFPVTIFLFSPIVSIYGAKQGILNGSLIIFALLFFFSLILGRAWCGWVCPGGGMAVIVEEINQKPVHRRRLGWIKWLIWVPWFSLILVFIIQGGGFSRVDPYYLTTDGVFLAATADRPLAGSYFVFYLVILLFTGLAGVVGKRAGCHTICWMAPFMIIGRWIRNRFRWPSLRLTAHSGDCTGCGLCDQFCPMSLEVSEMVQSWQMENPDCILCGSCIDQCFKDVIKYSFSAGK